MPGEADRLQPDTDTWDFSCLMQGNQEVVVKFFLLIWFIMEDGLGKLKGIAIEYWRLLNPLIPIGPLVAMLLIAWLLVVENDSAFHSALNKGTMEVASLFLLIAGTLIAFVRFCITRNFFFLWLTALLLAITFREIHWEWISWGVYVFFVLLGLVAYFFYNALKPYICSASFVNLIATVIVCYFISEMLLDHNWARIPDLEVRGFSVRSSLEECAEALGHFVLSASTLLIPPMENDSKAE